MKTTLSLLFLGSLVVAGGCNELDARTNPFDDKGIYSAADLDPQLAVAFTDGEVRATWSAVKPTDVVRYRLYRTIGATRVLLSDVSAGDATFSVVDTDPLPAGTDITYEVRYTRAGRESDAAGTVVLNETDDHDGDGFGDDDCAFNLGSVHPGAAEVCNAIDDDCDGTVDAYVAACPDMPSCMVRTCTAGIWGACEALEATEEVCDGLDNDCDGEVDEIAACQATGCEAGCGPGELCYGDACLADVPCGNAGDCPVGSICVADLGVCANPCGPETCAVGEACVAGACYKACADTSGCDDGRVCVYGTEQPPTSGGCAPAPAACADCAETCVRAAVGENQCCADADGDGHYALSCSWGDDCDDASPLAQDECDLCSTSDDCISGNQCVLVTTELGVCGGPAGCHCPDGSACDTSVSPPACVTTIECLEDVDCEQSMGAGFGCISGRCECTDFAGICPQCVLDAECGDGGTCNDFGQCQ